MKFLKATIVCAMLVALFGLGAHSLEFGKTQATAVAGTHAAKQASNLPTDGLTDFGNGAELRQPSRMKGQTFSFSFPSMQPQVWPGEMGLWKAKKTPGYVPMTDRFPVFLRGLEYQPWDLAHMPRHSGNPRPVQILRDRPPDNERRKSSFANLDLVVNSRLADKESRRGAAHLDGVSYVGKSGIPYELLVDCNSNNCVAEVYSEQSRFRFGLIFPSEGVAHTYDLVEAVDRMIVSWAADDNVVMTHWRDPASTHPAPVEEYPAPPRCDAPAYVRKRLASGIASPASIAVNSTGDVFFSSGMGIGRNKIFEIPAASIAASAPRLKVFSNDIGNVEALASDEQGRLYAAKSRGAIVQADTHGLLAGHFFDFASGFTNTPSSLELDERGNAFYIDFQNGRVVELPRASLMGETVLASGFDRATGLAIDRVGTVYVADERRNMVERLNADGNPKVLPVTLRSPGALAIDPTGDLFILDNSLAPIQRISPSGTVCGVTRELLRYQDLAVDNQGRVFATSIFDGVVDEFDPH